MSISANVSGLFVWAALCLAYIRYYYWYEPSVLTAIHFADIGIG